MKRLNNASESDPEMTNMRRKELGELHKISWLVAVNRLLAQGFNLQDIEDAYQTKFLSYLENTKPDLQEIIKMKSEKYKNTLIFQVRRVLFSKRKKNKRDEDIKLMILEHAPKYV